MRYLGMNLAKEVKDLHSENTTLNKEIKKDTNKWKQRAMLTDWKN